MKFAISAIAAIVAMCGATIASAKDYVQPIQVGAETVRWDQGEWLLDQQRPAGAVQLRHVGWDHGYMAFSVVIFNNTSGPINFDIANFRVEGAAPGIRLLSQKEMSDKAKSRARTAMFFTALAGGMAAASAANDRNQYSATTYTPSGTYRTYISAPNPNASANAALITAGTAASIALMQKRLDETRAGLKDEMIQMTTVDAGQSYGGLIYLTKFPKKPPTTLKLFVKIGDDEFPFAVRFVGKNEPQPAFRPAAVSPPPAFSTPASQPPLPSPTTTG